MLARSPRTRAHRGARALTREREAELLNNASYLICDGAHSSTFDESSDAKDLELKMRERLTLIDRAGRAKQLAWLEELLAEARQNKKENPCNLSSEARCHGMSNRFPQPDVSSPRLGVWEICS